MSDDLKSTHASGSPLPSHDDAALFERLQKLRALLPAFAEEAARARREAARLRTENAKLRRRVAEFERD
jgi:hypothetical protein